MVSGMLIGGIVSLTILLFLGGGGGLFIYLRSRPKKETWTAEIYQLAKSGKTINIKNGPITTKLELKDLRSYAHDVIEKKEVDTGITIYRLQKLNIKVPPVVGDVVEYWGKGDRRVMVLYQDGVCTLLEKGYDEKTGSTIFHPLPHERIDMITGQIMIRKSRLRSEKNVLQAISPWIVAGILMVGMVAMSYVGGSSYVASSENYESGSANIANACSALDEVASGKSSVPLSAPVTGKQSDPPSIE